MDITHFNHLTIYDQVYTSNGEVKDIRTIHRDTGVIYTTDGTAYRFSEVEPCYESY